MGERSGGTPLKSITQLIVHVFELIEAEGRELRKVIGKLGFGFALLVVSAALMLVGFVGLLHGLWHGLSHTALGPAGASAITGLLSLMAAAGLVWLAARVNQ